MADKSHIEWTDATWNPITGCSIVSPGCTNCYAMKLAATRLKHHPSRSGLTKNVNGNHVWTGEVRLNEQWLFQPLEWRKPRMIFVCAHGDLFHENVPDEWIDKIFAVMALAPHHTFQVLTKRADRMRQYMAQYCRKFQIGDQASQISSPFRASDSVNVEYYTPHKSAPFYVAKPWPLPNVWLGVSVENQTEANERIGPLMEAPAAIRFLSVEPMLGEIDLAELRPAHGKYQDRDPVPLEGYAIRPCSRGYEDSINADRARMPKLDWVIVGGESHTNPRHFDPEWARELMWECQRNDVPFFMKQMGGRTSAEKQAIPADLMVREWPLERK